MFEFVDIKIIDADNYFKVIISDYYKIQDYADKMKEIDIYD